MTYRVPFQRPAMPEFEDIGRYFNKSVGERYFSNGGPCAVWLEERVRQFLDVRHVVLLNNATTALLVASRIAFGGRPQRKVLVPSFTFAATATALIFNDFEPVFVDVDGQDLQTAAASLSCALERWSGQLCGALLCSTFGMAPSTATSRLWNQQCQSAGIPLLVDSAAGFGSIDSLGRPLGSQGVAEIFSFHATKPFAIGEGGCIATNDDDLAERARRMINFGFNSDRVVSGEPGINGKLPEILCATGLAVLDQFDEILQRRRQTAELMTQNFPEAVSVPPGLLTSAIQFVPVLVDPDLRPGVMAALDAAGIQARTYFDPPLHLMPAFSGFEHVDLSSTELVARSSLSLPMSNDLTTNDALFVAETLHAALS